MCRHTCKVSEHTRKFPRMDTRDAEDYVGYMEKNGMFVSCSFGKRRVALFSRYISVSYELVVVCMQTRIGLLMMCHFLGPNSAFERLGGLQILLIYNISPKRICVTC